MAVSGIHVASLTVGLGESNPLSNYSTFGQRSNAGTTGHLFEQAQDDVSHLLDQAKVDLSRASGLPMEEVGVTMSSVGQKASYHLKSLENNVESRLQTIQNGKVGNDFLNRERMIQAAVRSSAATTHVEVLRKEIVRLKGLHEKAVGLSFKQLARTLGVWNEIRMRNAFNAWVMRARAMRDEKRERRLISQITREHRDAIEDLTIANEKKDAELKAMRERVDAMEKLSGQLNRMKWGRFEMILKRVRNREVHAALNKWVSEVKFIKKTGRVLKKILNSRLTKMWLAWDHMVKEKHRLKRTAMLVLNKILKAELARGFETWKDAWRQKKESEHKLKGALMRMRNAQLTAAWNLWHGDFAARKAQEAKVRRAILKMIHRAMAMGWQMWTDMVQETKEQRIKVERALRKMLNRVMAGAWEGWKQEAHRRATNRRKLKKVGRRMKGDVVVRCYDQWKSNWQELKSHKGKMNKALQRLIHRQMAGAFIAWHDMYKEKKRHRHLLEGAAKKIINRQYLGTWMRWMEFMEELYEKKAAAYRCLGKLIHGKMAQGFTAWLEKTRLHKEHMKKLARAAGAIKNRHLNASWVTWSNLRLERLEAMEKANRALMRVLNKRLFEAFNTWHTWLITWLEEKHATEEKEYNEKEAKARNMLLRILNRRLAVSFYGWKEKVEWIKWALGNIESMLYRLKNAAVVKSFGTWNDYVHEKRAHKHKMKMILARVMKDNLLSAFSTWEHNVFFTKLNELEERATQAEHIALLRERYITANFVPLLKQLIKGKDCEMSKPVLKEMQTLNSKLSDTNFKDDVEQDEMPNEDRMQLERRVLILAQDEVARLQESMIASKTYANTIEREKDIQLQEMQRSYEARWKVDYQALRHANAQEARRVEEERKFLVKQMQAARRAGTNAKVPDLNVPSFQADDQKKTTLPDLKPQYKLDVQDDGMGFGGYEEHSQGSQMGSPRDFGGAHQIPTENSRRGSVMANRRGSQAPGMGGGVRGRQSKFGR